MKRIEPKMGILPVEDVSDTTIKFECSDDELDLHDRRSNPKYNYLPASLSTRNWAKYIDMIITTLIFILCLDVSNRLNLDVMSGDLITILPASLYFLLSDSLFNGQSVGKKLFNISVISRTTGRKCSVIQSFTRNILLIIVGPLDIGLLLSKGKRRLGDSIANTVVIQYS